MSRPSPAHLMPLADIELPRDEGTRLRVAGHLVAVHAASSIGVVAHGEAALLVDLSLCLAEDKFAPSPKSKLLLLGDVERRDETALPESLLAEMEDYVPRPRFDASFVLRVTLLEPVESLDLELWTRAARMQSREMWQRLGAKATTRGIASDR